MLPSGMESSSNGFPTSPKETTRAWTFLLKEEVLGDKTNNIDYEETDDPVSVAIAIEDLSDFISETELEPCMQEEE